MDTFQLASGEWKQLQSKLKEHLLDSGERVTTGELDPILDDLQALFVQSVDTVSQKAGSTYLDLLWKILMDSIPHCLDKKTELSLILGLSRTHDVTGHWEKALEQYNQAKALSIDLKKKELEADILRWMGHTHRKMGNWKESIKHNKASLRICREINYVTGEAYADNNLGSIYFETGEWQKATDYFKRALSLSRDREADRLVAQIQNNMGIISDTRGNPEEAILSYNEALPLYEKSGDMLGMAETYYNLAISYKHKGERRLVQKHLERSAELSRSLGERSLLAMIYLIKAELALEGDDHNTALSFKNFASRIFIELDDQLGIADTFRLEGRIYGNLGNNQKAEASYRRSIRINKDRNNLLGLACTYRDYGFLLGQQGNVKKAVKILRESLALYEKFDAAGSVKNIKDVVKGMDASAK